MKLNIEKSVVVITPTIGSPFVLDAIHSVQEQTYSNITHLIVIDGKGYEKDFDEQKSKILANNVVYAYLPFNTGGGGFYSHRVYSAWPHLVNDDYVIFLDEDNWFAPDHVRTLVDKLEADNLDFSYSLRKIHKEDGTYLTDDNCESLGRWPVMGHSEGRHLIDTSSYCFRRDWLIKYCHLWHSGWGGDARFLFMVRSIADKGNWTAATFDTTGQHTLHYRLGSDEKVQQMYGGYDFFDKGNAETRRIYGENYPWHSH